jgi:uncharacterized protein YndB with AHSA1/START domain
MTKTQITAEPGIPQVHITRDFDAPRDLVFRAYTEPELIAQWLGPRRLTTAVELLENRDGGRWRFVHTDPEGNEFGFHGVFHGTPSPDCILRTFEFEGYPGHVSMETLTLEEHAGKTTVRINAVFQTLEDRDGMMQSGMESGLNDSMERLDELLGRLLPVH